MLMIMLSKLVVIFSLQQPGNVLAFRVYNTCVHDVRE